MRTLGNLTIIFLFISTILRGQDTEIQTRLSNGELKMTFPSIYFKHNSTDYATMPYTTDSCFKYIATKIKHLNSYPIWRDSSETEQLTNNRITKLKADLNKFTPSGKIKFQTMGNKEKVSQRAINKSTDNEQRQYLLSLNSVLDVSGAIHSKKKFKKKGHADRPRIWCPRCWKNHRFSKSYRLHLKQKEKIEATKNNT